MKFGISTLSLPGRVSSLVLAREIDRLEEERMANIPTGQPPVVNPSIAKPGTMTPPAVKPPRPK